MKHIYYLPFLGLMILHGLNAQPCAAPWFFDQALQSPERQALWEEKEAQILHFFTQYHQQAQARTGANIRTIPVVVHIVHDNGLENLGDAQVQQGIAWLNEALANLGHFDQGSGADTEIRLCLAQRTPDNLPTNGITHTQSPLTQLTYNTQDLSLKNTIRWNPRDYLNIWVVREICHSNGDCGVGGYTTSWLQHGEAQDGIVVEARTWGADIAYTPIVAHEVGHYFGLYHTFQGGCANANCLNQGDRICDTPPDQSTAALPCNQTANSCNTDTQSGPFTSDQNDPTLNFMDYGTFGCMHDFTPDQGTRMNQILSGVRASLLDSKGCLPPCPDPITAGFITSDNPVLSGETVFFTDTSQNAAGYVWTINGQEFGTFPVASYLFTTPGLYTIQLTVTSAHPALCGSATAQTIVEVSCPLTAAFSTNGSSFQLNEPVLIQNNSQGQGTFEWWVNGVSQGPTLDNLSFPAGGEYRIELVMSNGSCSSTAVQYVYASGECDFLTYTLSLKLPELAYYQQPEFHNITVLADSNLLLSGYYDLGVLFAKIRPDGALIWVKTLDLNTANSMNIFRMSVCATPDTGFALVLPEFGGTIVDERKHLSVAKFSSEAQMEWRKSMPEFQNQFQRLVKVILTEDNHLVICGSYQFDGFLWAKLDLAGNLIWSKQQDIATGVLIQSITELPGGNLIAIGRNAGTGVLVKIGLDGSLLWKKSFSVLTTQQFEPELLYHPQENALYYHARGFNSLLAKWDTNGVKIWTKTLGNQQEVIGGLSNMRVLPNGDLAFCGRYFFANETGAMLLRTTADAFPVWGRGYPAIQTINDLMPLPNGGFLLAGNIWSSDTNHHSRLLITLTDRGGFSGKCEAYDVAARFEEVFYGNSFHSMAPLPDPALETDTLTISTPFTATLDTFCAPACNRTRELCDNGVDDDLDGLFDCLDAECDCSPAPCEKSKRGNIWHFGHNAGLDFNFEPPAVLTTAMGHTDRSGSTMSDEVGNLLLSSNGYTAVNRMQHPLGDFTGGLIVPHPGDKSRYFVFNGESQQAAVKEINMALNTGFGGVEATTPLGVITNFILEFTAVQTCENAFWVLTGVPHTNAFHAWYVNSGGLAPFQTNSSFPGVTVLGEFKFSPDGRRVAMIRQISDPGVHLFSFNTNTGTLTNPVFLPVDVPVTPNTFASLDFSPDGRFLYALFPSGDMPPFASRMFQYDLDKPDFPVQEIFIQENVPTGDIQLAPNGKIYVSRFKYIPGNSNFTGHPYLSVIHRPNEPGSACQYQRDAQSLLPDSTFGVLCRNISSDYYQPRISFLPDSPDTICGPLAGFYTYRVQLPPCADTLVQWSLDGINATLEQEGATVLVAFQGSGSGALIATLQTPCGPLTDTLHLLVSDAVSTPLDLGPDLVLCDNGIVSLDAGSGFSQYLWSNGSIEPSITTDFPGAYWVEVRDLCGIRQSDTLTISIAPESTLDLGPDLLNQCNDLTASYSLPVFFSQWNWSPADFLSCSDCPLVTLAPGTDIEWVVTAQNANGCISTDTLRVSLRDTLFTSLDTFVCAGSSLPFLGFELPPDTTALFFLPAPGAGCDTLLTVQVLGVENSASNVSATICPNEFFNYNGLLLPPDTTAIFSFAGSLSCDSIVTVNVGSYPPLQLTLPMDTTLRIGAAVLLEAETVGVGPLQLAWSPPDGLSCLDCPAPLASPLDTTLYTLLA
ncbi:MAG: M43 family zinc metalloprotease, partial [Saprospiraceae bacterium]|nr:M43 family zinc metalloprotease [Saprospiraceae bacterium]